MIKLITLALQIIVPLVKLLVDWGEEKKEKRDATRKEIKDLVERYTNERNKRDKIDDLKKRLIERNKKNENPINPDLPSS